MSNALHDYAKLFEKYAAANGGWGVILAGEDCLSLANEMMIDADALEAENAKLREETEAAKYDLSLFSGELVASKLENAKLRELVRTIYMCSCIQCDRCDYGHGDSCAFDAESELRELGVEVDG